MVKGIAIVIPGANFTNSPLGKVTKSISLREKAQKVVDTYVLAIGDESKKDKLFTLVYGLMQNGAWEGLDIYPMLGTDTKKLINLNPDSGTFKNNLVVGDNASYDGNGITFSNQVQANISGETSIDHVLAGYIEFVKVKVIGGTAAGVIVRDGNAVSMERLLYKPRFNASDAIIQPDVTWAMEETRTLCGVINKNSADLYVDSIKYSSSSAKDFETYKSEFCNFAGAKLNDSATTDRWNGTFYILAKGFIPGDKADIVRQLLTEFVD